TGLNPNRSIATSVLSLSCLSPSKYLSWGAVAFGMRQFTESSQICMIHINGMLGKRRFAVFSQDGAFWQQAESDSMDVYLRVCTSKILLSRKIFDIAVIGGNSKIANFDEGKKCSKALRWQLACFIWSNVLYQPP
ncbi:hypothetical protein CVT26_011500, partial [Gymnopilus dilepis]